MIDGIRDLIQNGKPIVVEADNWTEVEHRFRKEGIQFWGFDHFTSDDGGNCCAVSVAAKDVERAQELACMSDDEHYPWGFIGKAIMALFILALLAAVAMGGAL